MCPSFGQACTEILVCCIKMVAYLPVYGYNACAFRLEVAMLSLGKRLLVVLIAVSLGIGAFADTSKDTKGTSTTKSAQKTKNKKNSGEETPTSVAMQTGAPTGKVTNGRFGGIITFEQSLGLGTFVADKYARNPYYGMLLSLRPRYYINKKMMLELRFDIQTELTSSYTTSTTKKHQFMPSDTYLTFRYSSLLREPHTGITFSPYVRLGFPSSYESRFRDKYLSLAVAFDLADMLAKGHLYLNYTFRFTKNFNKYTVAAVSTNDQYPVAVARFKGNEELATNLIATGLQNTSFSFLDSVMVSWIINPKWTLTLLFGIINSFTYKSFPKDQYAAASAKSGRGQNDWTYGVLDLTYQPWRHYGFSWGISSYQPAKTANDKSFRFPFFDFSTEANNYTNFYFDVFASF